MIDSIPSHRLDRPRFCPDQRCSFSKLQVDIIRRHGPCCAMTHNFIGDLYRLDHRDISRSLDIATRDSYPIGLFSESNASQKKRARWLWAGDPDFAAFNPGVLRACAPRRAVMEAQSGPVNRATYHAAPARGMVRLLTWEAFARRWLCKLFPLAAGAVRRSPGCADAGSPGCLYRRVSGHEPDAVRL